jgi:MFS family permease
LKDTTRLPNPVLILVGATVMMSLAIGMRQCLGLFLPPVTHDLGLTAADYTFGIAAQNIAYGVAQAPVGAIADKLGLRPVLLFGAMLYIAAMLVMALANGVPRPAEAVAPNANRASCLTTCERSSRGSEIASREASEKHCQRLIPG